MRRSVLQSNAQKENESINPSPGEQKTLQKKLNPNTTVPNAKRGPAAMAITFAMNFSNKNNVHGIASRTQEQMHKVLMSPFNNCQILHNFPNNGSTTEAGFLLLLSRITVVFEDFPSPKYPSLDLPIACISGLLVARGT